MCPARQLRHGDGAGGGHGACRPRRRASPSTTTFAALAERGLHLVKPLTGDSLRQAIEGPAAAAGLRLEAGLVDLLVRDCEGEPGALPLLSHALAETWQRRDGRVLTVEAYRATGEIRGAVARSADRLYESLPAEQRPKLRSMLLRLVAPSPDGEPVRSRVATRGLGGDADRDRVLGLLVRARLVTTEEDSVELAHEALARAWPRLRSWLDEDAAGQRILRHLSTAADGWESLGRPTTELYRGARLEAALEWRAATSPDLTDHESAFLDASVAEAATEREQLAEQARQQARQNRRLRRPLVGVAVLLVAALVGGVARLPATPDRAAQSARSARNERVDRVDQQRRRAAHEPPRPRRPARRRGPPPGAEPGHRVGAVRHVHRPHRAWSESCTPTSRRQGLTRTSPCSPDTDSRRDQDGFGGVRLIDLRPPARGGSWRDRRGEQACLVRVWPPTDVRRAPGSGVR